MSACPSALADMATMPLGAKQEIRNEHKPGVAGANIAGLLESCST
jgi:hypothetical protein